MRKVYTDIMVMALGVAVIIFFFFFIVPAAQAGEFYAGTCVTNTWTGGGTIWATIENNGPATVRCYYNDKNGPTQVGWLGWVPDKGIKSAAIARCAQYVREDKYLPDHYKRCCSNAQDWRELKQTCRTNPLTNKWECHESWYIR